nr:sugar nucleotide-binding protein [uncultured Clostridium sp.]
MINEFIKSKGKAKSFIFLYKYEMYLIIGANGYVGAYTIKNILEKTTENIIAVDKKIDLVNKNDKVLWVQCDITNHEDIVNLNKLVTNKSETVKIIYLAAYHAPDQVLANPKIAWNINITALSDFLNTLDNVQCLFYSSTEMVYAPGNLSTKFNEDALKQPINAYGKNKVLAEALVLGRGYNVVRFPFLIGKSILKEKKHFYDIIVETICGGKTIEMFKDAYKTALDFDTATKVLVDLAERYSHEMPTVLNISGDEVISKYEIGLRIARKYNCSSDLIVPISMHEDNTIFTAERADCILLDNSCVKKVLELDEIKLQL